MSLEFQTKQELRRSSRGIPLVSPPVRTSSFSLYEGLRPWDSDQNDMIEQAMKMGFVLLEAGEMGRCPSLLIRWMKRLRAETNMLRLLGAYGHQAFDVIPQRNWY
ncbi:hypothetical protein RHMOL_Rhmol06G0006300 [Rhododendron molle]|uniref:Uncharacterized protein n=1 Tax=Rhododendron molle TaxID=49168 RepID=A0ACC0N9B8_RHOML|nr:hypothetical protein RHMOL_Rhmol06G0006300 [Rhododendron molle]